VTRNRPKVQSESDLIPAHASTFGFAVSYHFSISLTCGFAFGQRFFITCNHVTRRVLLNFEI